MLKQFAGLVDMAEEKCGPVKTTAEDLKYSVQQSKIPENNLQLFFSLYFCHPKNPVY